ncbi:HK97 gp10 family phage protein [Megasphaera paucivorans]|uniref:Bacteriophage HK97-gp10, putative tail-component n=1 Tax=Megasphaera paucivorans TaxID=349095 RepID=A0A1G9QVC1_9FIRM|nr:HK97 gp10 family phage protein [Megasphaera paucivorans]SDM14948.1 Bacteriophage HK97-gp10, putative tail-component [Megasphaera paucivorans]
MAEFDGLDELDKKLANMAKEFPIKRNQFLAQEAELLIGQAKENTPVDTGALREGWHRTRAHAGQIEIYNNTEYVNHVEYGHRIKNHKGEWTGKVVKGKKMLHIGMDTLKKNYPEDAESILEGLLK